ncbi:MAG: hypothetical protein WC455_19595 [Dehalococcoidia bacterium]|jgi:hypothetical protein
MTRAEMLAELYHVLNASSVSPPTGWEEAALLRYLAEGQDKFCEDTGYFKDITNYTLTLQTSTAVYAIPDRTIQVLDIWDGARRLGKILPDSTAINDEWPEDLGATTAGRPAQWQTDQTTGYIKLTPTPTAAENGVVLTLHLWRYSRYDLAGSGPVPEGGGTAPPAAPELPTRFQLACVQWAAHKAFNHHDVETQDPIKATDHLKWYKDYVSDGIRQMRRYHNQETRVGMDPAYRT